MSRLLYNDLHGEQRGSRDTSPQPTSNNRRSSAATTPSRETAAQNQSTQRRANWFVESTCTSSTHSVGQCAISAVRVPTPCGHWTSLHDAPPSFSLRLFTPYPLPPQARNIRLKRSSWKVCNEYGIKKCLPHAT
ncbi:BQ5605_C011g06280 [Microbotryum silenes-dioicae]|uniref:BQ5605_C011g06280 protein n=1 Tax=Microbotryum silenes-dioicae TaxID=796604 RepID=A0A2X0LT38_9BASI|nr:BQ5605_C011g06280 [Microbotryum silenes-dioicae]